MFRFVVRHLRWLAQIPVVPQIFDALLLTWTALFRPKTLHAIELLEAAAVRLPGVTPARHRFGGFGFVRDGREFAHLHGNGLLDVHLSRTTAGEFIATRRAEPHHVLGPSTGWVSFWIEVEDDLASALHLIEAAAGRTPASAATPLVQS